MVSVSSVACLSCALYPERVHSSFLLQLQECQEAVSRECEEEVERWRVSVGVRECEEEVERWRVSVGMRECEEELERWRVSVGVRECEEEVERWMGVEG